MGKEWPAGGPYNGGGKAPGGVTGVMGIPELVAIVGLVLGETLNGAM